MTLQTNAHRFVKETFGNGVRRADMEAAIQLFLEVLGMNCAPVRAFVDYAREIGYPDASEKQWSHVLKQMADQGRLYRTTHGGKYYYGKPFDGIYQVSREDAYNDITD